ncbi:SH3 domain-containing protein [Oryzibacter oryziterrae]|uniref:SH3 domain-containing protein n=1 Tax=Oryzibacter oryziterrae TaxID=2766474 RepID=UPI001F33235C|nr:SH3 domain-containing protein [Oryzibacter oryziterrae]
MRQFAATLALGLALAACQSGEGESVQPEAVTTPAPVITGALGAMRKDAVTPDAELSAFLADLAAKAGRSRPDGAADSDYADVASLFAPRLTVFNRGLEPDEPWHRMAPDKRSPLAVAESFLVEQGELPPGAKVPDYRPELMQVLVRHASAPMTYGRMPGFPGAVCSDAELTVDWSAAKAFAATDDLDTASLRLFLDARQLRAEPKAKAPAVGTLPAMTLFLSNYDGVQGALDKGWLQVTLSNGVKGWVQDPDEVFHGLSQQHLCFGREGGHYRVIGFYAYGL